MAKAGDIERSKRAWTPARTINKQRRRTGTYHTLVKLDEAWLAIIVNYQYTLDHDSRQVD
jgi:hypothetical protein